MTMIKMIKLATAVAIFLSISMSASGQQRCTSFGGTLYGWHDGKAWMGEGEFTMGDQVLHAKVVDVNTGAEKHGDLWWGTETASFDFGDGNKIDLMTEFTTEHMKDANGVFHVNMGGNFANGTGRFKNAFGHFNSQGPFGPGVVLPSGKAKPPAGVSMFWIGHYDGTICGIGK